MAAEKIAQIIDINALILSLDNRIPEYADKIQSKINTMIRSKDTADLLEIAVYNTEGNNRTRIYSERPPFNANWAELFYKYLRGKSVGPNRTLEAGIETVIADTVMAASEDFYTSEETLMALSNGLVEQIDANEKIQATVLAYREMKDAITTHGKVIMAARAHDCMSVPLQNALHSSVGTIAGKIVLTALATPVIKIAITILVALIFGAGGASVVGWLALPIIAGVLAYEYSKMRDTFAEKMALQVATKIREIAPEINRLIAEAFKESALKASFGDPTELGNKAVGQLRGWALGT